MKKATVLALAALMCMGASAKKEKTEILYGIKSGILTMAQNDMDFDFSEMPMMGGPQMEGAEMPEMPDFSNMTTMTYFDDYGRITATVTITGDRKTRTFEKDGYSYTIDDSKKTVTKMEAFNFGGMSGFGMTSQQIDWLNITDKVMKRNKIKLLGEEELAGVTCQKYSMKVSMMGEVQNQTLWIYKGIIMKTESDSEFGNFGTTVAKIEEDVEIPAEIFSIPEDYEVKERQGFGGMGDFMMMGGGDFGGGMGGFGGGF